MAIKKINEQGADVLYKKAAPVAPLLKTAPAEQQASLTEDVSNKPKYDFEWMPEILELVEDLKDTAESIADRCLGLAATQIWDKDTPCPSIFVMRWPKEGSERGWDWQEFINPVMKSSGKTIKYQEGCLSYPGIVVNKKRKSNVTMLYQTLDNPVQKAIKLTKLANSDLPHIIQHEVDHLNGVCIRSRNFKK
tara:strand:+ start:88 stop:663 length:576 start_codon:yes stop_codon:yes gene_type:complete